MAPGQADPTTDGTIRFHVLFSSPVTSFTGSQIRLGGTAGPATATVTGSGTSYIVSVSGMIQTGSGSDRRPYRRGGQDASGIPNQASTHSADGHFPGQLDPARPPPSSPPRSQPVAGRRSRWQSVDGAVAFTLTPYNSAFLAASTWPTDDGLIVTGAGHGGGPDIEVYSVSTGQLLFSLFAFDPAFTGGVPWRSATSPPTDVPDIIVGAGTAAGRSVKVFNGRPAAFLSSFFAFDPAFTGGVT